MTIDGKQLINIVNFFLRFCSLFNNILTNECEIELADSVKAPYLLYLGQSTSPALRPSSPRRPEHQPQTGQNCRGDAESETGCLSTSGLEQNAPVQGNYSRHD